MRVGYVIHTYPLLTHAFIQREVEAVRRAGVEVETFSIHRAPREEIKSAADRQAAATTEWILPVRPLRLIGAHARAFVRPAAYMRTLRHALACGPAGARAALWQLFYFTEAIVVWDWARRRRVDLLHAHHANVASDAAWLAVTYSRLRKSGPQRWTMTVHGPTEFGDLERFNLRRKLQHADGVVAISGYCREQLMSVFPRGDIEIIHCGADLGRYRFTEPASPPTTESDRPLRLLCVGQLVARKGQADLLRAVSRITESDAPALAVTIVGTGPDAALLRDLTGELGVSDRVDFAGPVGQDELPKVFARHDVFCLASHAEGIPVVIMEAMASGLPVVSTAIAGIPELVSDSVEGVLVTPGRIDELAAAIVDLATDREKRHRLAVAAAEKVRKEFDSTTEGARLARWFESLAEAPGRPTVTSGSDPAE